MNGTMVCMLVLSCIAMTTKIIKPRIIMVWPPSNRSTLQKNHYIATGLSASGLVVEIIQLCREDETLNDLMKINLGEELTYAIDMGSVGGMYVGRNKIEKVINNLKLSLVLMKKLYRGVKYSEKSVLIIPREYLELIVPSIIVSRLFRCPLITNIMEYPPALPSYENNLQHRFIWYLVRKFSNGYIVISKFLESKLKDVKPVFYLPAIVDSEQIENSVSQIDCIETVTGISNLKQCGLPILLFTSSKQYTDLLDFCIKALAHLKENEFIFAITGHYHEGEKENWFKLAQSNGIGERIFFTGYLEENDLQELEYRSRALLIPLLNNVRHTARFPQKILEYMLQERPIVSTNVGEIGENFTDNVDAFIADQVTPENFASKVQEVLLNNEKAIGIGVNGKLAVSKKFNSRKWGGCLRSFVEDEF